MKQLPILPEHYHTPLSQGYTPGDMVKIYLAELGVVEGSHCFASGYFKEALRLVIPAEGPIMVAAVRRAMNLLMRTGDECSEYEAMITPYPC